MRLGLAAVLLALPQVALGCTQNPFPDLRPWKERVAGASPMFIGTVVEIRGEDGTVWRERPKCVSRESSVECKAFFFGPAIVVFDVELNLADTPGPTFDVEQGFGSDCRVRFDLGQRWLFAGDQNESPSMYLNESYDFQQAILARKGGKP